MPADKTQTGRRTLQPACDACHVRRVKCSHDQPCAHCSRLGLTCTYTKAHTAKKTAGKRIEALRQAERTRQVYDGKREDVWAPQMTSPLQSSGGWGSTPSAPGMANGSVFGHSNAIPDPRYPPSVEHDDRHMPHFYTNAPPPTSSMGNQSGPSSVWSATHSPRGRSSQSYDADRQVRFQPPLPPQSASSVHHRPHSNSVGSTNSMNFNAASDPHQHPQHHQHLHQPALGSAANGGMPNSSQHYRSDSMNTEPHYLPSPTQFFPHPPSRSSFDQSVSGGGVDASTSTANVPFEATAAAVDYLQGSVLPPFSTSMADTLLNNQGGFSADNIFDEASLPSFMEAGNGQLTVLDMLGACLPSSGTPGSVDSMSTGPADAGSGAFGNWPESNNDADRGNDEKEAAAEQHPLSDSVLIPTLALFYERLGGVMPVFSRSWVFTRLDRDDHQNDPHFASMLIAMSALTTIQAQPNTETKDKRLDRLSSRKRRARSTRLLEEALRVRESPSLGQNATLEACCTSFFIFATLFGLGEHSAAWYRLRESLTLAHLCRLHEPAAYEGLARDEAERRLRTYWLLAITERAFAIQRGMPIMLTGNPRASTASLRAKLGFKELSDFPDLQLRLFDHVDEKFVDCWNRKCQGPGCPNFDAERAIALWRSFTDGINQPGSRERSTTGEEREDEDASAPAPSSAPSTRSSKVPSTPVQRRQIQRADVEVTRHWLLNRLWLITLNHGLLSIDARDPPLRVDHAIHVAQSVYDVCDGLSLSAMEAHGVGFTYKLYDIAQTLVLLCKDEMIAEAISKGGVGEQLEKQTTAAHTSGRSHNDGASSSSTAAAASASSNSVNNSHKASFDLKTHEHLGYGHTYGSELYDAAFTNATRGPASLRRTVLGILNEFLSLFQRFRGGDHPYLDKLLELINELRNDMDPTGPPSTMTDAATAAAAASLSGMGSVDHASSTDEPTTVTDTNRSTTDSMSSRQGLMSGH